MSARVCHAVPSYILHDIAENSDPEVSRRATETLESMTHIHTARKAYFQAKLTQGSHSGPSDNSHDIVPNYVLEHLTNASDVEEETRQNAADTLAGNQGLHEQRSMATDFKDAATTPILPKAPFVRSVYDMNHSFSAGMLPGRPVRLEGQSKVVDRAVNEVYDNCKKVLEFFRDKFNYLSLNGANMPVVSSVHFGTNYQNASWVDYDRSVTPRRVVNQMIYGDGADPLFNFTTSLDVIGHEMTVSQVSTYLKEH